MSKFYPLVTSLILLFSNGFAQDTKTTFPSFTGKVSGNKVRLRAKPDLDCHVIKNCIKDDLFLVIGEENDFWKVQPPEETKAYIFRSFVLDGTVEVNRVNIRLSPDVDAPILGQFHKGDKIEGKVCQQDHKWLEITPPKEIGFYIAKEYVAYAGAAEYLKKIIEKQRQAKDLLGTAFLLTEQECKKPFDEMCTDQAIKNFEKVIEGYSEFAEIVKEAKEGLSLLQDNYLQKKLTYLEEKANINASRKDHFVPEKVQVSNADIASISDAPTKQMLEWKENENKLYKTWSAFHIGKSVENFYQEQKINAVSLKGSVVAFDQKVKNKPGNFILQGMNAPLGYIYSTKIDLQKYAGKQVTVIASPRANNHFAFPAYFVLEIKN